MRIGIIGAADIAFRRFLPALAKVGTMEFAGVASRTQSKAERITETFGGVYYPSYEDIIADPTIDAIYLPLPPALHYGWGKRVLESGKHLLMEKPFTTSLKETEELVRLSEERQLTVHENYMFLYHEQLGIIKNILREGRIGDIRLLRLSFGFPKRADNDFRYNKALGGGALLDCGGYPVRLALELLGNSATVKQRALSQPDGYEVDLFGSAVLQNDDGLCAQVSFGMDNAYQCRLEVWGSRATLIAPRIFTAGADFQPTITIRGNSEEVIACAADDQFMKSILAFENACASNDRSNIDDILRQARLVESIRGGAI